jgi:N utilization substance protein B
MNGAESNDAGAAGEAPRPRSARRRAREFALQGLYGWLLGGGDGAAIAGRLKASPDFAQADEVYFFELMRETTGLAESLRGLLSGVIDRPLAELSPVEHSILLIASYELAHRPEIPYRVVINEAVELAKVFGGTDGHRYVNGVLDKLAGRIRVHEAGAARA